ncbi:MAG: glycosyltransferase [bacterium]|nr:glycosyltransferase [bacterium]MDZ4299856.1 glycosyltransferase [Candidatus Sungbacteria bacterium]
MDFPYKIYYIANARMPTERAHGIQLAKMCEAFLEVGVNLELVVPRRETDTRSVKDFYGLRVDIPLKRLRILPLYTFGRFGFFLGSLSFAVGYFFYLGWKHWVRHEKFVIYTTDLDQFSFFLIPFLGVPYFVEMHDAKKKLWQFILLFRYASGVISINEIIKAQLCYRFHVPNKKNIVEPNAVDRALFDKPESKEVARTLLGLSSDRRMVMYIGKVYPWKGLGQFVEAAILMPNILFYLVGGTAEELRTVGLINEQPANLVCVGQKPFAEIPRWLWAADVLIVLGTEKDDYSYFYTSPMKIFEYAAARRPILASVTPAIASILSNNEAFVYPADKAADIPERIRYIFEHPDEAQDKVNQAYQHLHSSWGERALRIVHFMESQLV